MHQVTDALLSCAHDRYNFLELFADITDRRVDEVRHFLCDGFFLTCWLWRCILVAEGFSVYYCVNSDVRFIMTALSCCSVNSHKAVYKVVSCSVCVQYFLVAHTASDILLPAW